MDLSNKILNYEANKVNISINMKIGTANGRASL